HHNRFMDAAIEQALKAAEAGEVPVGAVLAGEGGEILACAYNQSIRLSDPTAHAEILALREAAGRIKNYRLLNTCLYVTIEPCLMCMGAAIHARVSCVVFGAADPGWGAAGSIYNFAEDIRLNHHPEIVAGIREEKCRGIIVDFFAGKRMKQSLQGSGEI
ncbi:MAG: tRNA adenosine(34) deaminase TadA, partial [Desulfobacterales bacterium]